MYDLLSRVIGPAAEGLEAYRVTLTTNRSKIFIINSLMVL